MKEFNLPLLASEIANLHHFIQQKAFQQVNTSLTMRNWLVGLYVVEYEQNGSDRAIYGAGAIKELAGLLKQKSIRGLDERSLRTCRTFYLTYPQIWGTVSAKLQISENETIAKWVAKIIFSSAGRESINILSSPHVPHPNPRPNPLLPQRLPPRLRPAQYLCQRL